MSTSARHEATAPARLVRASDGRVVAGVCRGLSRHLGIDVNAVRAAFFALSVAGGAGIAMYAAFWAFAPQGEDEPDALPQRRGTPREIGYLVAVAMLAGSAFVLARTLRLDVGPRALWPVVVAGSGVVILWTQADESQRARWRAVTGVGRAAGVVRAVLGVILVIAGGAPLAGGSGLGRTSQVAVAALVVVVGLALVTGPWWMRMARDLAAERAARIREQERAEIAAHVHDSVLHTLALIQRHVEDPREVARLARAQERDLRAWLYRPAGEDDTLTLRRGLEDIAAEVEDAHGIVVEVVAVGDCSLDERGRALLLAVREALVNAAKYAGAVPVSVYAEVEPSAVVVFVRDRGPGFNLAAVPADRLGVRQSILGRMERNGGRAVVRSAHGGGTEVILELPSERQERTP